MENPGRECGEAVVFSRPHPKWSGECVKSRRAMVQVFRCLHVQREQSTSVWAFVQSGRWCMWGGFLSFTAAVERSAHAPQFFTNPNPTFRFSSIHDFSFVHSQ
jgi:hypothetical protein